MTTSLHPHSNIRVQIRREQLECREQPNGDEDEHHAKQIGTTTSKIRFGHEGVHSETDSDERRRSKSCQENLGLHKHAATCHQHRLEDGLSVTTRLYLYEESNHDKVSGMRVDAYYSVHQYTSNTKKHKQWQRSQRY